MGLDFIAIGDTVVDEFIKLKEAHVSCDVNHENCTISMKWGDKIPYDSSVLVPAVGNAANAAVSASRLGLSAAFVSNVGKDNFGEQILDVFKKEGVDTKYIAVNDGIPTNHHYVLSFDSERTILIRHEKYPYVMPERLPAPKWIYFSSVAEHTEAFNIEIAKWLREHPETKLAFQPGTFQIKMGKDALAELYAVTEVVAVNKEEAQRILETKEEDMRALIGGLHMLGPNIVLITDGTNGAYAAQFNIGGTEMLKVPMYPDPSPPINRTGAGDAMTSTFVCALALGKTLAEALLWGPVNSMSVVQHIGAQKGLLTREALLKLLAEAPEGYRVESLV